MEASRLGKLWRNFRGRLKDPLQLRFILAAAIAVPWYFLVYPAINGATEEIEKARVGSETHLALAREIVSLRAEVDKFRPRLPAHTDPNEWVEYLLSGVRLYELRLVKLEPREMKKQGPFDVMVLTIDIQGRYSDLEALLVWVESNPRLFRIDMIDIAPTLDGRTMSMKMTILGIMG
jgi:Tfp pilus assembly protein PilO